MKQNLAYGFQLIIKFLSNRLLKPVFYLLELWEEYLMMDLIIKTVGTAKIAPLVPPRLKPIKSDIMVISGFSPSVFDMI